MSRFVPLISLVARYLLGVVLLWAGSAKVSEPGLFAHSVRAYDVLPLFAVNPFAVIVPWIEVLAGTCLLAGFWVRGNALLSLSLLASFGAAIVVNLIRGAEFSCGCFALDGTEGSLAGALVRDLALVVPSVWLLLVRVDSALSLDRTLARPSAVRRVG